MPAPAATLVSTSGNIHVEREGARVTLAVGDPVFATDTVVTDSGTTATLRFTDGATARLSPDTRLDVREYAFGEGEPSFVLNLAQGAMRSVSGEVVKQNPDAFKITSPQATVGIRGTELFNAVVGGKEVHAVVFVDKGHVVVITAHDGRSITMDSALQSVQIQPGELGPLTIQKFSFEQMQEIIRSLAPTLVDNQMRPDAREGHGEDDKSSSTPAASAVVLVVMDAESAPAAAELQNALGESGIAATVVPAEALTALLQGDTSLGDAWTLVSQVFAALTAAPAYAGGPSGTTPPPDPGITPPVDPPGPVYLERAFPSGIAAGSTTGFDHLLAGADPTVAQQFTVTGTVAAPLVGNALIIGGATTFSLDELTEPTTESTFTAGDIFTVDRLTNSPPDDTYGISCGIYGDAVMLMMRDGQRLTLGNDTISVGIMDGGAIYGDIMSGNVYTAENLVFGNDSITVGTMTGGAIYGDTETCMPETGTLTFGNDVITVTTLSTGMVYGDADSISANTRGGDDTITISDMTGGTVYGDARSLTGGAGGNDSISIGNLVDGTVYGDASTRSSTSFCGNDTISIGVMYDGTVYGDANNLYGGTGGNDSISIGSLEGGTVCGDANIMPNAESMTGGTHGGDDTIHMNTMNGGFVLGDASSMQGGVGADVTYGGNDNISIGTMNGGYVCGDAYNMSANARGGNDVISIAEMLDGYVYGDAYYLSNGAYCGDDTINIGIMHGGTVYGDGNDSLTPGHEGSNTIRVGAFEGAGAKIINGGYGTSDMFIYDNMAAHKITLDNIGNVTIYHGADNGHVSQNATISGFEGIGGGAGNDTLVTEVNAGRTYTLSGGGGADTFECTLSGGRIIISDFERANLNEKIVVIGTTGAPTPTSLANGVLTLNFDTGTLQINGGWSGADAQAAYDSLITSSQLAYS